MSPEILVCDEIGTKTDYRALQYAVNSGVKLVCTCHAADFSDLKKRPAAGRLIRENAFDYAAILGTGAACGRLTAFYELAT
jgi:stage III sporulation protein AA